MAFTLQLLHASDFEGGVPAAGTSPQTSDAVRFSAAINQLRTNTTGPFGLPSATLANTLTLSSGDNYIPGPFFNASSDPALNGVGGLSSSSSPVLGRGDVGILNAIGIQASALGNHEFDLGTRQVRDILRSGSGNPGVNFPYLSTNLDFTTDENLRTELAANQTTAEASTIRRRLAKSTVITLPGPDGVAGNSDDERVGIVGATTPTLRSISSPGTVGVRPGNPTDYVALAAEIQTTVDALTGAGINKIVLLAHMQQFTIEANELAPRLRNVDVIVAGGSHSLFANATNPTPLRSGDTAVSAYPTVRTSASGQPVLVVNTPANYRYVGRLVVDFDTSGVVQTGNLNPAVSGAYSTDQQGLDTLFGSTNVNPVQFADPRVVAITDGIRGVIATKDNSLFGRTSVFLDGNRAEVRTQETNLGNLTADANLAYARQFDRSVTISLKNGGGIRDNIGSTTAAPGATGAGQVQELPPQPTPLSPNKPVGAISQLDIENSLRFNNALSLVTVTATQLKDIMEHAVAGTAPGETPGRFPQIGGFSFSFNPTGTARTTVGTGNRVQTIALTDSQGRPTDIVVANGVLVGNPNRTFRMVTLNFLAGGGDSYPLTTATNRRDLLQASTRTGRATFADNGSEQDALAEFTLSNFSRTAFNQADQPLSRDRRIQNLAARRDGVLPGAIIGSGLVRGTVRNDLIVAGGNRTTVSDLGGNNRVIATGAGSRIFTGAGNDQIDLINGFVSAGNGNNVVSANGANGGRTEVRTGVGNDRITLLRNNNRVFAGEGVNTVSTGEGDDLINAGNGTDRINAGRGRNTVNAGAGDNIITSIGRDQITVGRGNNRFVLGRGDGVATINGFDAGDRFVLTDGLRFRDLRTVRSGADTRIVVGSNNDLLAVLKNVAPSLVNSQAFI